MGMNELSDACIPSGFPCLDNSTIEDYEIIERGGRIRRSTRKDASRSKERLRVTDVKRRPQLPGASKLSPITYINRAEEELF